MVELTRAEEHIMLIFWKLKKAFVKEVIQQLPKDPKPPYNTVSSIARILVEKGYLAYKAYGKTHEYYPLITKTEYRKTRLKKLMSGYFSDSPFSLVSSIVSEEKLSREEIEKLKDIINNIE